MTEKERGPGYRELAGILRTRIEAGEFRAADPQTGRAANMLPQVSDLVEEYGSARLTVRRAIDELAKSGLVRPVRGVGTHIVDQTMARIRIRRGQTITRSPIGGYVFPAASTPGEVWYVIGTPVRSMEPAPDRIAEIFGLTAGSPVLRRRRVTSPQAEVPFQIADSWISPEAVADAPQVAEIQTGPGGYLDRLEEAGHGPIAWQETTRARMPTTEEARLLQVPEAMPVLEFVVVGRSGSHGRPVEVTMRVVPSDRVEMVADLRRDDSAQWPREEAA